MYKNNSCFIKSNSILLNLNENFFNTTFIDNIKNQLYMNNVILIFNNDILKEFSNLNKYLDLNKIKYLYINDGNNMGDIDEIIKLYKCNNNKLIIYWVIKHKRNNCEEVESIYKYIDRMNEKNISNRVLIYKYKYDEYLLNKYYKLFDELIINFYDKQLIFKDDIEKKGAIQLLNHIYKLNNNNKRLESINETLKMNIMEGERLKILGEISSGIVHDINNILTSIVGSTHLLKNFNIRNLRILKNLKNIEISAYDGMKITQRIKQMTKQCFGINKTEVLDINKEILSIVDICKTIYYERNRFRGGEKLKIITKFKSKDKIKVNSTLIREVLINIIKNSIEAMPNGGTIRVKTETVNEFVNIEVKDNGIGMSEEVLAKVFSPFFSTKRKSGSGIGLNICYEIIKSYNGYIHVKSKIGEGTTFTIQLPKTDEVKNDTEIIMDDNIEFQGNILIIDDNAQIRNIVAEVIKSLYNCNIKAINYDEVDSEIEENKYDIILCDLFMGNINGLDIANKIKKKFKDIYFCIMTGWIGKINKSELKNVDYIINKPIYKNNLLELFKDYKVKSDFYKKKIVIQ